MIWIFKKDKASATSFDTYAELFSFIEERENLKLLEEHTEFAQTCWSFRVITPKQILSFHNYKDSRLLKAIAQQACSKNLPYLEICTGDPSTLREMLLTPDIDLEALQKEWSLAYCTAHNYLTIDYDLPKLNPSIPSWQIQAVTPNSPFRLSTLVTPEDCYD